MATGWLVGGGAGGQTAGPVGELHGQNAHRAGERGDTIAIVPEQRSGGAMSSIGPLAPP
jgi:hypothetical protein